MISCGGETDTNRTQASILLIAVFMARGTSFLFSKTLMGSMTPMSILAVRFILAFLVLAVLFNGKLRRCDRNSFRGGLILGILYTICMVFEMFGLKRVDSGIASLIENMAIVLVPVFVAVLTRTMPKKKTMFCALLAVAGVGFLSVAQSRISGGGAGILLTISAAVTYAFCIMATEKVSRDAVRGPIPGSREKASTRFCTGSGMRAIYQKPRPRPDRPEASPPVMEFICSSWIFLLCSIAELIPVSSIS